MKPSTRTRAGTFLRYLPRRRYGRIPLSWKPPCRSRQVGEGASLRRNATQAKIGRDGKRRATYIAAECWLSDASLLGRPSLRKSVGEFSRVPRLDVALAVSMIWLAEPKSLPSDRRFPPPCQSRLDGLFEISCMVGRISLASFRWKKIPDTPHSRSATLPARATRKEPQHSL